MAAASTVIPMGLLHMRSFQLWLSQGISSKGQSPEANRGYVPGASYPIYVVQTRFLTLGPTLGPCCLRKMLMTDASRI